jgi:hypothetical protein
MPIARRTRAARSAVPEDRSSVLEPFSDPGTSDSLKPDLSSWDPPPEADRGLEQPFQPGFVCSAHDPSLSCQPERRNPAFGVGQELYLECR